MRVFFFLLITTLLLSAACEPLHVDTSGQIEPATGFFDSPSLCDCNEGSMRCGSDFHTELCAGGCWILLEDCVVNSICVESVGEEGDAGCFFCDDLNGFDPIPSFCDLESVCEACGGCEPCDPGSFFCISERTRASCSEDACFETEECPGGCVDFSNEGGSVTCFF